MTTSMVCLVVIVTMAIISAPKLKSEICKDVPEE